MKRCHASALHTLCCMSCAGAAMATLLAGLQGALRSVTTLQLTVLTQLRPQSRQQLPAALQSPFMLLPEALLPGELCGHLAAALPALQHLKLTGPSQLVGLEHFGSCCKRLSHITAQACTVPVHVFSDMNLLPNLQHVTVSGGEHLKHSTLQGYVNGVLGRLSGKRCSCRLLICSVCPRRSTAASQYRSFPKQVSGTSFLPPSPTSPALGGSTLLPTCSCSLGSWAG